MFQGKMCSLLLLKITINKTHWSWVSTFSLSADAIRAERVFNSSATWHQVTGLVVGKETEPGTVGGILAGFETLEFILRWKNIQMLTVGALSRNKTLEVFAVSWIWKAGEKKNNWKNPKLHLQIDCLNINLWIMRVYTSDVYKSISYLCLTKFLLYTTQVGNHLKNNINSFLNSSLKETFTWLC